MRAAGCYSAKGVEMTAKTIMVFMVECNLEYFNAAGRVMVVRDEIWREDEYAAFREAFVELYGDIYKADEARKVNDAQG